MNAEIVAIGSLLLAGLAAYGWHDTQTKLNNVRESFRQWLIDQEELDRERVALRRQVSDAKRRQHHDAVKIAQAKQDEFESTAEFRLEDIRKELDSTLIGGAPRKRAREPKSPPPA